MFINLQINLISILRSILAAISLIILMNLSCAADFRPKKRLSLLSEGINIAHWLWKPELREKNFSIAKDLRRIKKLGYRHVRLPIDMLLVDETPISPKIKAAIRAIHKAGLAVIVVAFGDFYNKTEIKKEKAKILLARLARHIRHFSPSMTFLQVANEPCVDPREWREIQKNLLVGARSILPYHTLITTTPVQCLEEEGWGQPEAFASMLPYEDSNIVYAFHFYEPYAFTHQGAEWDLNVSQLHHLPYPKTNPIKWEQFGPLQKFLKAELQTPWTKAYLRQRLDPILQWQERHKRPIMATEYGVYKSQSDTQSRENWIKDIKELFRHHHILQSRWSFGGGFG